MAKSELRPVDVEVMRRLFSNTGAPLEELGLYVFEGDTPRTFHLGYIMPSVPEDCRWLYTGRYSEEPGYTLWVPYTGDTCLKPFTDPGREQAAMTTVQVRTLVRAIALDARLAASELKMPYVPTQMTLAIRLLPDMPTTAALRLLARWGFEELHQLVAHTGDWMARHPGFEDMEPDLVRRMHGVKTHSR